MPPKFIKPFLWSADFNKIDLQKDTFPILVKLDWELSGKAACPDKRITILRISKTN